MDGGPSGVDILQADPPLPIYLDLHVVLSGTLECVFGGILVHSDHSGVYMRALRLAPATPPPPSNYQYRTPHPICPPFAFQHLHNHSDRTSDPI